MRGPYYVTTESRRMAAWGDPCGVKATAGRVTIDGRTFSLASLAVPAFKVWEAIRAKYNYRLTGTDTGFYNCRHMRHNPSLPWSVHAWAMAMDVNWLENPAGSKLVTDIPQPMIDEILAVRTNSGARLFRWGGDWDWDGISTDHSYVDAMHWEVVAHPLDLETGINYEVQEEETTMKRGDKGFTVALVQQSMIEKGQDLGTWTPYSGPTPAWFTGSFSPGADGDAGATFEREAKVFQASIGMPETGVLGSLELSILLAGKDGEDGADGADGADGTPGTDGEDGEDGMDGQDGLDGAPGREPISARVTFIYPPE